MNRYEIQIGAPTLSTLYLEGNLSPRRACQDQNEWIGVGLNSSFEDPAPEENRRSTTAFNTPIAAGNAALSPEEAYDAVLNDVGANVPFRDAVDRRLVNDVRNGTGKSIDHPDEVGAWPTLSSSDPPLDSDGDGMPDTWEKSHGLDPSLDDGADDKDADGYTNIEDYLNHLVGE